MKHIDERVLGKGDKDLYTKIDDAIYKEDLISKNIVQVGERSCCVKSSVPDTALWSCTVSLSHPDALSLTIPTQPLVMSTKHTS